MTDDYAKRAFPAVSEEEKQTVREAVEKNDARYFKSRDLELDHWTNSRVGWILGHMDEIEIWSDRSVTVWGYEQ